MSQSSESLPPVCTGKVTPPWFVRFGERTHPLLLPLGVVAVLAVPFFLLDQGDSLFPGYGMSKRQILGTGLLFSLLPGYTLLAQFYTWRIARSTVNAFAPLTPPTAAPVRVSALSRPGWWFLPVVLLGGLWGSHEVSHLSWLKNFVNETGFDLWFRFMAAVSWVLVFWMLCWRLQCSIAMYHLGRQLQTDVYRLHGLGEFVRLPLVHLLVVVGGLVLLPLQSLDFQLRWINYRSGLFVGLPAMLLLVLPPIWGLHNNMRDRITARLSELQTSIEGCDRNDFAQLALLVEHRETVRGFPSWPLDVGLVGKLVLYLIIPPLAWVAAALVERAVDTLV